MRDARAVVALCLVVGVAAAGAAAAADGLAGLCSRCHEAQVSLLAMGGHAPALDCVTCHEERRPGRFGRGHRSTPSTCTSHHAMPIETHPPMDRAPKPARLRRSCLKCHEPHGSENSHLVRPSIRTRGRVRPVEFHDDGGSASFVDPARPGRGLCEVCHRTTKFYLASGHGASHFTGDCTLCHDHAAGFRAVVSDANCAVCHPAETAHLEKPSLHRTKFAGACSSCHVELTPEPGPGHRARSACADCHSPARVATHVPPGIGIPCTGCHDAHGSDNIRLVRDAIETLRGTEAPVRFDDVSGRADGSFASASAPGTGLCEVCHTRTQFYRADGAGAPHYTTPCESCHPHEAGFLPR
jgi:predicted CXXCH cytochrome family protein